VLAAARAGRPGCGARLEPELTAQLAFARQKVDEVVLLGRAVREDNVELPAASPAVPAAWRRDEVRSRLAALVPQDRQRGGYKERAARQQGAARAAGAADHDDRVVSADGGAAQGPRRAARRGPRVRGPAHDACRVSELRRSSCLGGTAAR